MSNPQPMSIKSVSGDGSQAAVFFLIPQEFYRLITMYNITMYKFEDQCHRMSTPSHCG